MITFDIPLFLILQVVAGTLLPLLVGLVTKRETSPGRKAVLLAALSVLTSLLTEIASALQTGVVYNLGTALLASLVTFLVAVGTHYGLWKPTGTAGALQDVGPKDGRHEA
jgi:hypothetical protein